MKRINNRAFTIVELIASVAIMGIIMLIAVPSVFSIVEKNKKTTYLNDAKKMISMAKSKFDADATITEPTDSLCVVFRLKDLNKSGLEKGPNNGKYNPIYSYVTINYKAGKYIYGVQLLEQYKASGNYSYRGIPYTKQDELEKEKIDRASNSIDKYIDLGTLAGSNSLYCPSGLVYADGSAGDGSSNGSINEGDILSVSYQKGANVERIEGSKGSCVVLESKKGCTVTPPTIVPKDGYSSVGWSVLNGSHTGENKSLYLNKLQTIYYANAIDNLPPIIELEQSEDQHFSSEKRIKVKISDLGAGIASGAKFKYGWSLSKNKEPDDYTNVEPEYHDGDKEITFEAVGSGFNGNYYLWVVPTNLRDKEGNSQVEMTVSNGVFKYNSTRPVCQIVNAHHLQISEQTTLLLTCIDKESPIIKKELSSEDLSVSTDSGKVVSVSEAKEVANGYEYQVVVEAVGTGQFRLILPEGKIENEAGNTNDVDVVSDEMVVSGAVYYVQYATGNNILKIEGGDNFCITSGKEKKCTVTLPTITPALGYEVVGWFNASNEKVGEAGTYQLDSNHIQLTAKVEKKTYKVSYDYQTNGGNRMDKEKAEEEIAYNDLVLGEGIINNAYKEDWDFVGWNTDPNATIALSEYHMPAQDITLYAIFSKSSTATIYYYNMDSKRKESINTTCSRYNNDENCHYPIPYEVTHSTPGISPQDEGSREVEIDNVVDGEANRIGPNGSTYVGLSIDLTDEVVSSYTSENHIFYAVYYNEYTLNYQKEENSIDSVGSEEVSCGIFSLASFDYENISCKQILPEITTKPGYSNAKWVTNLTDQSEDSWEPNTEYDLQEDTILYAKATDEELPVWTVAGIRRPDSEVTSNSTISILLRGTDTTGRVESSLSADNIEVLIDGEKVEPQITEVSQPMEVMNGLQYTFTITGIHESGSLSLLIAEGTLKDSSNNLNAVTSIITGITVSDSQFGLTVCKRATSLHSSSDNLTYGNLGTAGVLSSGDAFDCDVNTDGIFNGELERFYYLANASDEVGIFIYYSNVFEGKPDNMIKVKYHLPDDEIEGPASAILELPTIDQWSNVNLLNKIRNITNQAGEIVQPEFSYMGYAARLLTLDDIQAACGSKENVSSCSYLLEGGTDYFLENCESGMSAIYYINSEGIVKTSIGGAEEMHGVRPVIEVPFSNISY